jgi:hypothetical protein
MTARRGEVERVEEVQMASTADRDAVITKIASLARSPSRGTALTYPELKRLAAWHLAAVQRELAKAGRAGKVVGYVGVQNGGWLSVDEDSQSAPIPFKTEKDARYRLPASNKIARLVLVPARRKRRAR